MTEIQSYRELKQEIDPDNDSRLIRYWHGYLTCLCVHKLISEKDWETEKRKLYAKAKKGEKQWAMSLP